MDRKQQVLLKLKPKVKAFGFNKKEVMGIAARIADNLTSTDDASDEDVYSECYPINTQLYITKLLFYKDLKIVNYAIFMNGYLFNIGLFDTILLLLQIKQ